jgi:hypothetical protein
VKEVGSVPSPEFFVEGLVAVAAKTPVQQAGLEPVIRGKADCYSLGMPQRLGSPH